MLDANAIQKKLNEISWRTKVGDIQKIGQEDPTNFVMFERGIYDPKKEALKDRDGKEAAEAEIDKKELDEKEIGEKEKSEKPFIHTVVISRSHEIRRKSSNPRRSYPEQPPMHLFLGFTERFTYPKLEGSLTIEYADANYPEGPEREFARSLAQSGFKTMNMDYMKKESERLEAMSDFRKGFKKQQQAIYRRLENKLTGLRAFRTHSFQHSFRGNLAGPGEEPCIRNIITPFPDAELMQSPIGFAVGLMRPHMVDKLFQLFVEEKFLTAKEAAAFRSLCETRPVSKEESELQTSLNEAFENKHYEEAIQCAAKIHALVRKENEAEERVLYTVTDESGEENPIYLDDAEAAFRLGERLTNIDPGLACQAFGILQEGSPLFHEALDKISSIALKLCTQSGREEDIRPIREKAIVSLFNTVAETSNRERLEQLLQLLEIHAGYLPFGSRDRLFPRNDETLVATMLGQGNFFEVILLPMANKLYELRLKLGQIPKEPFVVLDSPKTPVTFSPASTALRDRERRSVDADKLADKILDDMSRTLDSFSASS